MCKITNWFGGSMRRETTKIRKRISRAARKRQLMMAGGAGIVLILVIILAVFVFGSCATDYEKAETNTVYVLKNGKIISTDVEAFDEKIYDKAEFKSYVKDVIDTYNSEIGKKAVKQKSFEINDSKATLVLEYADADVYEKVNSIELFTGTINEAQEAGYEFDCEFAKLADGKAVTATSEEFMKNEDYKVVILKSNTKVVVPGEICYVSTENTAKLEEDWILIEDGSVLLAEEIVVDTEFGTEAEGADGSISEEELVAEEDIVFDFGKEEKNNNSQFSDVLTYIIYK